MNCANCRKDFIFLGAWNLCPECFQSKMISLLLDGKEEIEGFARDRIPVLFGFCNKAYEIEVQVQHARALMYREYAQASTLPHAAQCYIQVADFYFAYSIMLNHRKNFPFRSTQDYNFGLTFTSSQINKYLRLNNAPLPDTPIVKSVEKKFCQLATHYIAFMRNIPPELDFSTMELPSHTFIQPSDQCINKQALRFGHPNENDCIICQERLVSIANHVAPSFSTSIIKAKNCSHRFHAKCLIDYINKSGTPSGPLKKRECPICDMRQIPISSHRPTNTYQDPHGYCDW